MTVTLDLQYGFPENWTDKGLVYIPVSPEKINRHTKIGWTIYDLEELAFVNIPPEFTDERVEVGKRLQMLGDSAILHTYGPFEGDYYIAVSSDIVAEAADL